MHMQGVYCTDPWVCSMNLILGSNITYGLSHWWKKDNWVHKRKCRTRLHVINEWTYIVNKRAASFAYHWHAPLILSFFITSPCLVVELILHSRILICIKELEKVLTSKTQPTSVKWHRLANTPGDRKQLRWWATISVSICTEIISLLEKSLK